MAASQEDDQLLQDASTLLMFANVAAKQLHQSPPLPPHPLQIHLQPQPQAQAQPPQPPQPSSRLLQSDASYASARSPAMQINNMIQPRQPQPPPDQLASHINPHQGPMYQRHRPILQQIPHSAIPGHGQAPLQISQSLPPNFQHPNSSHMPQRLPPARSYDHGYQHPQNFPHSSQYIPPEQYTAPIDPLHAPNLGVQSHRPAHFTAAHSQLPPPVTSRVASRRSSQSSIPHILNSEGPAFSGAASSKILMASLLEPPTPTANSGVQGSEPTRFHARLTSPPNVQGSQGPHLHGPDVPAPYHRRTVSNPHHLDFSLTRPSVKSLAKFSPMQGININTQVRNTSNAMIAAAALAAAAEVPLPLKTTPQDDVFGGPLDGRARSAPKSVASKTTAGGRRKANKNVEMGEKASAEPGLVPQLSTPDLKPMLNQPLVPLLDSYKVDPDSGAIGCICEIADDDGFTIQCDICFRWQHCLCMGFKTSEQVPEAEYKCYYCDEKKWGRIDAAKCKADTLARLDKDRSEKKTKEIMQSNLKRKALTSDKPEKRKRVENGSATSDKAQTPFDAGVSEVENSIIDDLPNKDNELLTDGVTAEAYESVYFRTKLNDYKTPEIKAMFESWGEKVRELHERLSKADQKKAAVGGVEVMSLAQFKALKLSRIILPNHAKYLESHKASAPKKGKFNKTAIRVGSYSDNQKQKFSGFSKLALMMTSDGNETADVPIGTTVIEYVGELDTLLNYVADCTNQYSLWGTTKPRVADSCIQAGSDSVDIVLDSRFVGNESRFIRKACHTASNCELKVVYIPDLNLFKFLVVTSRPISLLPTKSEEELRLDWKWAPTHPINKVSEAGQCKFDQLEDRDKAALISCVDNILHFTECGCSTSNANLSCSIFKVKKATSYLLRSTRKASGISTVNLMRPKDELVKLPMKDPFVSWDQRLLERAKLIDMRLTVSTEALTESEPADELDVVESSKENDIARLTVYFKVPFRQQVSATKIALISPESETSEITFLPTNQEPPFKLLPEVSHKIDEMIDAKLQSAVKKDQVDLGPALAGTESPGSVVGLTSANSPTAHHSGGTSKVQLISLALSESNDALIPSTRAESPKVVSPPVKKLSFADYKKKKL